MYVIQLVILIVVLLIGIFLIKMANTLKIARRINRFSLVSEENKESLLSRIDRKFWKLIHSLSKGLSRYKLVNRLSSKYDKYILEINKDKVSPEDYFTIKLLILIGLLSVTLVSVVLGSIPAKLIILVLVFLIGYFLPDLFWKYLYIKRTNRILNDVYSSTKYIYYGLVNGKAIDEALSSSINSLDGDITDELLKMRKDLRNNISLEDAYYKFYKRSGIKEVKYLSDSLRVANKLNISYKEALSYILEKMDRDYTRKNNIFKVIDVYNYLFLVVLIIPLLVFVFGLFIKLDYFMKLMNNKGLYLMGVIVILYSIYIYVIKNILEVSYE